MIKNWSNPEIKKLALECTQDDTVILATDPSGSDAKAYSEAEAKADTYCLLPTFCGWYYYDRCTGKWINLGYSLWDAWKKACELSKQPCSAS